MTKQEFVDASRRRAALAAVTRARRSTRCSTRDGRAEEGRLRHVHRLRQVLDRAPRGARGRQPAQPRPEGAHPGGDRAEVLGRQPAEGGRQGGSGDAASSRLRRASPTAPPNVREGRAPRGPLFGLHTNICSPRLPGVQLAFDAADRLVELVEERRGPVRGRGGRARASSRSRHVPGRPRARAARRRRRGRRAARLARRARSGSPIRPARRSRSSRRRYVVVDLETTGLSPGRSRDLRDRRRAGPRRSSSRSAFETLVEPGRAAAAGDRGADRASTTAALRGAPPAAARRAALPRVRGRRRARRPQRALRPRLPRPRGRAADRPPARGARRRHGLARAAAARRAGRRAWASPRSRTSSAPRREPCHRALPGRRGDRRDPARADRARAGARRARRSPTSCELAAPRARRVVRASARSSPARRTRPGVYLFRDATTSVLYVGRARDLRARLRSYFRTERQRPAVEAALGALERIEWRVLGSELEAALEELRLIRELRPPANARGARPDRYVYLRRRGDGLVVDRDAERRAGRSGAGGARPRAARALRRDWDELTACAAAAPALRARLARPLGGAALRGRRAAARPDRGARGGRRASSRELERLRALELCLLVPALEDRVRAGVLRRGGRVVARCARCRPAAAAGSSSRPGSPQAVDARRARRSPPRTPTSCSSSARSSAPAAGAARRAARRELRRAA